MPRELVTIQVGQCGNQIGCRFWDLALREHAQFNKNGTFDDPLSSFFRNVDARYDDPLELPVGNGTGKIRTLKARAVLIDTETGVLDSLLHGPLRDLFDSRQLVSDVYGAGNNWAHGFYSYGQKYRENIEEAVRRTVEFCDSLQSFFLLHSLGGGTGSGLGTYVLNILEECYPEVYRFTTSVFPSADDDVVTSPYNSVLALQQLTDHADCVLPIENQALSDIVDLTEQSKQKQQADSSLASGGAAAASTAPTKRSFDAMNNIAAHLLSSLTSSMRFEGSLNVDLNEVTMNLVPFPRLHYLLSSLSPVFTLADNKLQARSMDQMFSDCFSKKLQLAKVDPRSHTYLACALLVRGSVQVSDINRNISRIKPNLRMIPWNQDGFKIGLCGAPSLNQPQSVLCLANNTCIKDTFLEFRSRFCKLYKRKVFTHHYTEHMEMSHFDESLESLQTLIDDYARLDSAVPTHTPRIVPVT